MENSQHYINELEDLKNALGEITGNWNGKSDGLAEERAGYADDAITKINEIIETIKIL